MLQDVSDLVIALKLGEGGSDESQRLPLILPLFAPVQESFPQLCGSLAIRQRHQQIPQRIDWITEEMEDD